MKLYHLVSQTFYTSVSFYYYLLTLIIQKHQETWMYLSIKSCMAKLVKVT